MPEGPEVSYMTYRLNEHFKGKKLEKIKIESGRYRRHSEPAHFREFNRQLPLQMEEVSNKGKFIYILLKNSPYHIGITLGLTGDLILEMADHSHYHFITSGGNFYMDDMRNFGTISFLTPVELEAKLATLGKDFIHQPVREAEFIRSYQNPKYADRMIAMHLMDQTVFSGIGNYLRSEVLYRTRIDPFKKVGDLSTKELKRLYVAIKKMMKNTYRYFIKHQRYDIFDFQVYGQKRTPKGETVLRRKMEDGRTLHYVE